LEGDIKPTVFGIAKSGFDDIVKGYFHAWLVTIMPVMGDRRRAMEILGTKSIDELGRIIVPKEVRQAKGWETGDKINFYDYNGIIVMETDNQNPEP